MCNRKTCETIMKTPRNLLLRPGKYYHIGICNAISRTLKFYAPVEIKNSIIELDVNIDGLPIYSTSSKQFWPILGHIKNIPNSNPFIIGIYLGTSKPKNADCFLNDFIEEMLSIDEDGLAVDDFVLKVKLCAIICDMPAKAFVKYIKGHNAYYSCTMCIQSGEFMNGRMCFPECDSTLRTDMSFRNRTHEEHHLNDGREISPFERLPDLDMVMSFPLDYMHLLLIGVTKKIITAWRSGDLNVRIGTNMQNEMTNKLLETRKSQCRCFSRLSRSLTEFSNWRATEFRTFLLYTGPVILKNLLPADIYTNFL